jgi:hypothetical protein
MNGHASASRGEVDASHFERGLGLVEAMQRGVHGGNRAMNVGGIEAQDGRRQPSLQRGQRMLHRLGGIPRRRIAVADAPAPVVVVDPQDDAALRAAAARRAAELAQQRHGDAKNLDAIQLEITHHARRLLRKKRQVSFAITGVLEQPTAWCVGVAAMRSVSDSARNGGPPRCGADLLDNSLYEASVPRQSGLPAKLSGQ